MNKDELQAMENRLNLMIKTQCNEIGCKNCTLHIYDENNKKISCDVCELQDKINDIKFVNCI